MATMYTNEDGLTRRYGGAGIPSKGYTRKYNSFGNWNQLVVDFDYDNLEVYDAADSGSDSMDRFSELMAYIPAGASIVSAYIAPMSDFDEAVDVGLYEKDGSAIDADGLVAAATPTQSGGLVTGAGDEVGSYMSNDAYIVVAPNAGDPTSGAARLIVNYIK